MKKAISTLKKRIEDTKKKIKEKDKDTKSSDKPTDTTTDLSSKALDIISQKDTTIATDEDIIDAQQKALQDDIDELQTDEEKIKLLTKEHEHILKRNAHLDKILKETQLNLTKQKSHNIELDEIMQSNIDDVFKKYQSEYSKNVKHAEELFEMITTMKNIYTTKKNKLLLSQNRQLKKSLDEAYKIIQENEDKTITAKLNHKQKHLEHLQRKRTKKKLKRNSSTNERTLPPIYRVKTPRK